MHKLLNSEKATVVMLFIIGAFIIINQLLILFINKVK